MKKLLLINLLILILAFCSQAQNWAPLNRSEKYNYRLTGASTVSAQIKVDSAKLVNGDSVYYLNRIAKVSCDSCYQSYSTISNLPQFLQRQVTLKGNGVYNFTDTLNLALYTLAPLLHSWLYDSTTGITAQVVKLDTTTIFNTLDSVKAVALSSGDTIMLSKSFGIIRYPYKYGVTDSCYTLTGIEGPNLGEQLPGFKGIFNWNVGDIFQIAYSKVNNQLSGGATYNSTYKLTVTSKYQNSDTLRYSIDMLTKTWTCCGNEGAPHYVYSKNIDTLTFIDSANHFANSYPNEVVDSSDCQFRDYFSTDCFTTSGYVHFGTDSTGRVIISPYEPLVYDTIALARVASSYYNTAPIVGAVYTQGLGITDYAVCNNCVAPYGLGYQEQWHMVAYRKGSDTIGTLTADSVLQSPTAVTPSLAQHQAKVYPNPASNYITIALKNAQQGTITLSNLQGQMVKEETTTTNITAIDISTLPAGMYLLSITTETGTEYVKVVKQ